MAITYVPIATQTLTSAQTTVAFTSIPQTYTDLRLVMQIKNTLGVYLTYAYEPTFGTLIYSGTYLLTNGTTATAGKYSADNYILPDKPYGSSSTGWTNSTIDFMSYSNTSVFKTTISRTSIPDNSNGQLYLNAGLIRSTSAISNITLASGGGNYATGSTFALYGIKAT